MNDSARVAVATPTPQSQGIDSRGLCATVVAFLIWGLFPLYMMLLQAVPVLEITAHRMLWGCLCGFALLAVRGEIDQVWRALADPPTRWRLCASAALIAINWSFFMWGIAT